MESPDKKVGWNDENIMEKLGSLVGSLVNSDQNKETDNNKNDVNQKILNLFGSLMKTNKKDENKKDENKKDENKKEGDDVGEKFLNLFSSIINPDKETKNGETNDSCETNNDNESCETNDDETNDSCETNNDNCETNNDNDGCETNDDNDGCETNNDKTNDNETDNNKNDVNQKILNLFGSLMKTNKKDENKKDENKKEGDDVGEKFLNLYSSIINPDKESKNGETNDETNDSCETNNDNDGCETNDDNDGCETNDDNDGCETNDDETKEEKEDSFLENIVNLISNQENKNIGTVISDVIDLFGDEDFNGLERLENFKTGLKVFSEKPKYDFTDEECFEWIKQYLKVASPFATEEKVEEFYKNNKRFCELVMKSFSEEATHEDIEDLTRMMAEISPADYPDFSEWIKVYQSLMLNKYNLSPESEKNTEKNRVNAVVTIKKIDFDSLERIENKIEEQINRLKSVEDKLDDILKLACWSEHT